MSYGNSPSVVGLLLWEANSNLVSFLFKETNTIKNIEAFSLFLVVVEQVLSVNFYVNFSDICFRKG